MRYHRPLVVLRVRMGSRPTRALAVIRRPAPRTTIARRRTNSVGPTACARARPQCLQRGSAPFDREQRLTKKSSSSAPASLPRGVRETRSPRHLRSGPWQRDRRRVVTATTAYRPRFLPSPPYPLTSRHRLRHGPRLVTNRPQPSPSPAAADAVPSPRRGTPPQSVRSSSRSRFSSHEGGCSDDLLA